MVNVTINITDIDEYKLGFLKAKPKPSDSSDTDLQHFYNELENWLFNVYKTGKQMIAQETTAADIDEDIVTVS